jgi:hypothetical protein
MNNISGEIISATSSPKNKIYTNTEIKTHIDNMSEDEIIEVFRIVLKNNEKYSKNNNGIFINISKFKPETIQEISQYINYCECNNAYIDMDESERQIHRDAYYSQHLNNIIC